MSNIYERFRQMREAEEAKKAQAQKVEDDKRTQREVQEALNRQREEQRRLQEMASREAYRLQVQQKVIELLEAIRSGDPEIKSANQSEVVAEERFVTAGRDNVAAVALRWGNKLKPTASEERFLSQLYVPVIPLPIAPKSINTYDYKQLAVYLEIPSTSTIDPDRIVIRGNGYKEYLAQDFIANPDIIFPGLIQAFSYPNNINETVYRGTHYWRRRERPPRRGGEDYDGGQGEGASLSIGYGL